MTAPTIDEELADLQRECDAMRIMLAEERERRMGAEAQRDRLVGIINDLAERFGVLEARLDQIIGLLGVKRS